MKNPGSQLRSPGVEENRLGGTFIAFNLSFSIVIFGCPPCTRYMKFSLPMYYARNASFSFILVQVAVFECHSLTETYIKYLCNFITKNMPIILRVDPNILYSTV